MSTQKPTPDDVIVADDGVEYPADVYDETTQASKPNQQAVADAWAAGELPTHNPTEGGQSACLLYSSPNFSGYQLPDGSGFLKHYRTYECVRSRHGVLVTNTQCYARGWAHCSTPSRSTHSMEAAPLTSLAEEKGVSIFNIEAVHDVVVDEDEASRDWSALVDFYDEASGEETAVAVKYGGAVSGPLTVEDEEDIFVEVRDA